MSELLIKLFFQFKMVSCIVFSFLYIKLGKKGKKVITSQVKS